MRLRYLTEVFPVTSEEDGIGFEVDTGTHNVTLVVAAAVHPPDILCGKCSPIIAVVCV